MIPGKKIIMVRALLQLVQNKIIITDKAKRNNVVVHIHCKKLCATIYLPSKLEPRFAISPRSISLREFWFVQGIFPLYVSLQRREPHCLIWPPLVRFFLMAAS